MTGLTLDVRLDGFVEPIGKLKRKDSDDVTFSYAVEYLNLANSFPLSISLPLQDKEFDDAVSRSFFSNLLQERNQPIKEVREKHGVASSDLVGLLFYLGAELAGAVSILPEGSAPTKVPGNIETDYNVLARSDLIEIVRALYLRTALPNELRDPSPLTGYQSKISLLMLDTDTFALAKVGTGAPTTHVLKVPDRDHLLDPEQETMSLHLSALCKIPTVPSSRLEFSGIPALVTKRFDRLLDDNGHVIRLHQEDFAQALSLPPTLKYQRKGIAGRRFDAQAIGRVLDETANPAIARASMLKNTLFDLLIGNVDGHAKNHALLYTNGTRPDLAPRYDVLPTLLDPNLTNELSYEIGNAKTIQEIDEEQFSHFMSDIGISSKAAQNRLVRAALDDIVTVLAENFSFLAQKDQKIFADLIATNMKVLLPKLNYLVPKHALLRDDYVAREVGY